MGEDRFTAREKANCAKREVAMRKRVYDNPGGRVHMFKERADREIAIMQAIADDYCKIADEEEAKGRLL